MKFYIWLEFIWAEINRNAWSIFAIFLMYLLLWKFDQAQDLLLSINQHIDPIRIVLAVPLLFASIFVLAYLIWNIPIYLNDKNYKSLNIRALMDSTSELHDRLDPELSQTNLNDREKLKHHIQKHFSAVLAMFLMLLVAFAIINSMIDFRIIMISKIWLNLVFGLISFYLILLLNIQFYEWNARLFTRKWVKKVVFNIGFPFLVLLIIVLGYLNYTENNQPLKMSFLFISQISSSLLLAMLIFGRNYISFDKWKNFLFASLSMSVWFFVLLFIVLNLVIAINPHINPLVIFVAALIFYLVLTYTFKLLAKKWKVPFFTIFLILIVSLSIRSQTLREFEHYAVPLETYAERERPTLESYVKQWIDQREDQILKNRKFPIYLVSSQGGGSKAGLWSALTLGYINQETKGKFFNNHLFSLTGASGGSVGNGLFFAEASQPKDSTEFWDDKSSNHIKTKMGEFYENNYLSSSISGLLGRDFWQSIIGTSLTKNRGEILAEEWERNFAKVHNNTKTILNQDFLSFYEKKQASLPLLIVNTTHIQSGRYCYISPVAFETTAYIDFYELLDSCYCFDKSIKLSTALSLNASFPLIGSVGDIRGCDEEMDLKGGQLADAGYYDNIGGTITEFIYDELEKQLIERGLRSKVELVNLVLVNENTYTKINPRSLENYNQLTAPLHTVMNVREGHTYQTSRFLSNPIFFYMHNVDKDKQRNQFKPIIPLGRYLSEVAVEYIENQLQSPSNYHRFENLITDINQNSRK
ncbi:hypothetical protein NMK71_09650 [Weeksellaceae bacterium KMM 9713]|uniref:Patatin-like phospholipase n=1 Tax=Profundicola chukchiensis TaxID=2961959 RepID=A0A9X4RW73_9FLAO|nr:hypothetical protein [Profundicola chukchiensis]MDG4946680.1 hypothetical protein [Profundicola chukchiensis]